jgi:hypothetical protein
MSESLKEINAKEKLIMKAVKECVICSELVDNLIEENPNAAVRPLAREVSQAITIGAGGVLFSPAALEMRIRRRRKKRNARLADAPEPPPTDWFQEAHRHLKYANNQITQRGHGFTDSQKETLKQTLFLIFRNLGGEDE